jgi:hypothetical protein
MYVTGLMIWGAAAVASLPEPKLLDKGLIFIKDTDILLSENKWTIVVNIVLYDYATFVDHEFNVEPHSPGNTGTKEPKIALIWHTLGGVKSSGQDDRGT